ncbi:MAG: PEP-CTERM sorting domain-containing protein [Phycisphaerae bacterium]
MGRFNCRTRCAVAAGLVVLGLSGAPVARAQSPYSISVFDFDNVSDSGTESPLRVKLDGADLVAALGRSVPIRLDKNLDGTYEVSRTVFAGVEDLPIHEPADAAAVRRDFLCVELDHSLSSRTRSYDEFEGNGRVGWLIDQMSLFRTDKDKMAGLQIAVWELVYDLVNGNAANLDGGIFALGSGVAGAIRDAATGFIAASNGKRAPYRYYRSPVPGQSGNYQDLVSVPEPATLVVLALGGLLLRRRPSESWRLAV